MSILLDNAAHVLHNKLISLVVVKNLLPETSHPHFVQFTDNFDFLSSKSELEESSVYDLFWRNS
jgi:hypothetical protein